MGWPVSVLLRPSYCAYHKPRCHFLRIIGKAGETNSVKKFWNNKRVLVAGGAGFIGSHTVDALITAGARVSVVSIRRGEYMNPRAHFYRMATSSSRLASVFRREKPFYVFAFAAVSSPPISISDPIRDAAGLVGLVNLLELSRRNKVKKLLYSSSGFIYGNTKHLPTPESEPFQPLAPYNISKFAGEKYVEFYREHFGLASVILRYGTVYGPRQRSRVIADYITKIADGKRAEIYGTKTRDYVYVSDVVATNLRAMEVSDYRGESIFNIGSGKETDMADVYRMIAQILGQDRNKPIHKPSKLGEVDHFWLDVRRARRILGFRARVKLKEGLRRTVEWFQQTHQV